jgi:CHAD domain-containing protein
MKPTSPTLDDIARAALRTQLQALVEQPDDMEGVHQRRVATRRLRALLRVFRDALPAEAEPVRAELAWLGSTLGAVRDLDVQMASIHEVGTELGAPDVLIAPVVDLLDARRTAARDALELVLDSTRYAALLDGLRALADSDWPPESQALAAAAAPRLIDEREARFRDAIRQARARAPAARLHRARIRTKQLRYTLEFFAGLYGKPASTLIRRLVKVQDVLGTIQDSAALHEQLESVRHLVPLASMVLLEYAFDERARAARARLSDTLQPVRKRTRWRRLDAALAEAQPAEESSVPESATP